MIICDRFERLYSWKEITWNHNYFLGVLGFIEKLQYY